MLALLKKKLRVLYGYVQNDKGIALITTIATTFVLIALGANYYMKAELETAGIKDTENTIQAFYNAQTGIHWAVRRILNTGIPGVWLPDPLDIDADGDGLVDGQVQVRADFNPTDDRTRITARGTVNGETRILRVELLTRYKLPGVDGAAALYGPRSVHGGVKIDGRNHDIDGTYNGTQTWNGTSWAYNEDDYDPNNPDIRQTDYYGTGKWGVVTNANAGQFSMGGNSKVGGTEEIVMGDDYIYSDWAPANPASPGGILYESDVPASGDDVFIDPDTGLHMLGDTLKTKAINAGSYWSTDPDNSEATYIDQQNGFEFTLNAVNYIELTTHIADEGQGQGQGAKKKTFRQLKSPTLTYADGVTPGSAIVVITTDDGTGKAVLGHYSGTFAGLMITDNILKLSGDLIGATVVTNTAPSGGGASIDIGSGHARILYSSLALARIMRNACPECPPERQVVVLWVEDNRKRDDNLNLVEDYYANSG